MRERNRRYENKREDVCVREERGKWGGGELEHAQKGKAMIKLHVGTGRCLITMGRA